MPEQGHAGFQASLEDVTGSLEDFAVPATVLARWAAVAGRLATVGYIPTQPNAA